MIVIADGGSTKTSWCVLANGKVSIQFITEGYNPYYITPDYFTDSMKRSLPEGFSPGEVAKLYFYGAGCADDKFEFMTGLLKSIFTNAEVFIAMDLLAAARALLGHSSGFAAILGTGTNSCLYNGKVVAQNIDSLGFMLGDEGSGAYIGKQLIADYIRGYIPKNIHDLFWERYQLTPDRLMDTVYTKPYPNRFCSGFARFVSEHIGQSDYLSQLANNAFDTFFRNIVVRYPDYKHYTFNCVGAVGYHFSTLLGSVAQNYDMQLGKFLLDPMEGLVAYHLSSDKT